MQDIPQGQNPKKPIVETIIDLVNRPYLPTVFFFLGAALSTGLIYFCWFILLPMAFDWAMANLWRWLFMWIALFWLALIPIYAVLGTGYVLLKVLEKRQKAAEAAGLSDLERIEADIMDSENPIDFARYSRNALRVYYDMGQNQVKLSFYVGVASMIFGFLFLLTGLAVQMIDTAEIGIPWLRNDANIQFIAVGGGVIIEFIAVTFLWTYRAAIIQLNVYYRRQMLIHSGLLAVSLGRQANDQYLNRVAVTAVVKAIMSPSKEIEIDPLPEATKGKSWREWLGLGRQEKAGRDAKSTS